jgi:hypothetical protein
MSGIMQMLGGLGGSLGRSKGLAGMFGQQPGMSPVAPSNGMAADFAPPEIGMRDKMGLGMQAGNTGFDRGQMLGLALSQFGAQQGNPALGNPYAMMQMRKRF